MAGAVGEATVDVRFDDRQIDGQVKGLGSRMRGSLGAAGKAAGLALGAGLAVAGAGMVKAIGDASDLNESITATKQVFEASAGSILEWSETTSTSLGLSQQAALEGAKSIGAMLKPMGIAPKAAGDMSQSMVQLAADMASFNNEDPSEMLDRIRAGLSGESEPLKRYGTVLSEARVQQFAWANGIADSGKALTDQEKVMARYGLLLQDTKDQQGDFARTSDGLANQQRILKAELADASAQLGTALLPAAVAVVGVLRDLVPPATAFAQSLIGAVVPAVQAVGAVVAEHWPAIRATIVGVVDFVRAALGAFSGDSSATASSVGSSMGDVRRVFEVVGSAVAAVVAHVRGVVQQVASAIRAHSAEIRATMQALRAIFEAVWPAISRVIETAWAVMRTIVDTQLRVIGNLIRAVMAAIRGDWSQVWSSLRDAAGAAIRGAATVVRQVLTGLGPAVLGLARTVGAAIVRGIANGLVSLAATLGRELAKIPAALLAAAASVPGIAAGIGRSIVTGILSGLGGLFGMLKDRLESTLRGALSSLNPFSSVEHGGEIHIGRPLARGAVLGWVEGSRELPGKIADGVRAAVENAKAAIESQRGRLTDAWGNLSSDLGAAFDAAWSKPTAAEAALERLEREGTVERLAQAIGDARKNLAAATTGELDKETDTMVVDPEKVVAAQRALDEALRAQQVYNLQQRAAIERRERDARVALERRHFEQDLADLQARLTARGASEAQANAAVLALMRRYRISYANVGAQLGRSFTVQLRESLGEAVTVAENIAEAIEAALRRVRRAAATAKPSSSPSGVAPSGLVAATADPSGAGPLTAGAGGGGTLYGATSPTRLLGAAFANALRAVEPRSTQDLAAALEGVEVNVYVGDTPLRGIVRHEVKRHDAGIARELATGVA